MQTADPQQRAARLAELTDLLKIQAAPEDRDLVLSLRAGGLRRDARPTRPPPEPGGPGRPAPGPLPLRGPGDAPCLPALQGPAGHPRLGPEPERGRGPGGGRGGRPPARDHDRRDPHAATPRSSSTASRTTSRRPGSGSSPRSTPSSTVRRQWETDRGDRRPPRRGGQGVLLPLPDRAGGLEGAAPPDRARDLLGAEVRLHGRRGLPGDGADAVRDLGPRLASRRGRPAEAQAARAFLEWLLDDNYIFMGTVRYRLRPDGTPDRVHESATGVFTDPALLPVVFPGLLEEVEGHIAPAADDDRIIDIDYCNNASAIYHLEPIDDIVVREWGPDGSLVEATLLLGRLAKGAFTEKASEIPLLQREARLRSWPRAAPCPTRTPTARSGRSSTACRERELFYADVGSLKEIIDRIVSLTADDEIAVYSRRGSGYVTLYVAFSRLRYSVKTEADLGQALAEAFGPVSFSTSADCGAVTVLLAYFDAGRLEHPVEVEAVRRITRSLVTTWEDRVAAVLEGAFGEREGRRLFSRYVRSESRSGLYRESTPPEEVPEDIERLERLEGRLELSLVPRSAEVVTLKLYSIRALRAHRHPPHPPEPRAHRHRGAAHSPDPARRSPGLPVPPRGRGAARADRRPPGRRAPVLEGAPGARRASGHRRPPERPHPPRRPGLARGGGPADAPEPPASDPALLQRGDRQRRAAPQQRGGGGALRRVRRALRPGPARRPGGGHRREQEGPAGRAGVRSEPGRGRGAAGARQPDPMLPADELLPAAGAAGRRHQAGQPQAGRPALAAAAGRDLRPLPAAGGHPPPGRPRGPGRHPLERPPRTTSGRRSWV